MQGPSGSRAEHGAGQGFNLDSFTASFASSRASAESAPTVKRALRYLTNSSFPDGWKKAKGDYNPPQTSRASEKISARAAVLR
ncbi:Hypothetical protein PHPALM_5003 [Phytophthora palmivora]|uniref:Uncharacterized protein n=1 Tax=Phytophthora palmivora TaxID=4796 RepID=A0A2P4YIJ2_9STRA|nr:Hypothetical protein PHPALM_5003 [Phytophthora palmivora]